MFISSSSKWLWWGPQVVPASPHLCSHTPPSHEPLASFRIYFQLFPPFLPSDRGPAFGAQLIEGAAAEACRSCWRSLWRASPSAWWTQLEGGYLWVPNPHWEDSYFKVSLWKVALPCRVRFWRYPFRTASPTISSHEMMGFVVQRMGLQASLSTATKWWSLSSLSWGPK